MATLVRELNGKKEASEISLEAKGDMKVLMSSNSASKVSILKNFGLAEDILEYEKLKEKSLERKSAEKDYGTSIFHVDEIQSLCSKYALRLLSPRYYFGSIGEEFTDKVIEFAEERGVRIGTGSDQWKGDVDKFVILAPVEHFSENKKKRLESAKDAILFFRIDNDYYKMVHNWGDSFDNKRLFKGWRRKNIGNWYLSILTCVASVILLGLSFLGLVFIWNLLIALAAGAAISTIGIPWRNGDPDHAHQYFTDGHDRYDKPNYKKIAEYNIIAR